MPSKVLLLRRAALVCLASLPAAVAAADDPPPALAIDEVSRGQRGYGLSVFAGTEPERFEVEVIGVLRNYSHELSYIMARLSGHDLETSGVAQGMSGSPVYIDGRLAGAVSFSFNYAQDAIAGITPIAGMRAIGEGLSGLQLDARPLDAASVPSLDQLAAGRFAPERLEQALGSLLPPVPAGAGSTVQWQAAGFEEPTAGLLRRALGNLTQGGGASADRVEGVDPAAASPLVAGSSLAMVLIRGDLSLAAHGTVTEIDGERVIGFGHPVFGAGPLRVPMARSEVVITVASRVSSFKIANAGPIVGAFDLDREAGVQGRLGVDAPTIPVHVRLRGVARRDYKMEIADVPFLTPGLLATATLGALKSGSWSTGGQGIDLEARLRLTGHPELVLRQSFDSDNAAVDSAIYLLTYAGYLTGNQLEAVHIEAVDVTVTQSPRQRAAALVAAHADRRLVAPGESVEITLELQPYRGARSRRRVRVQVPEQAADGRYVVLVGDGSSMDAARRQMAPREPATLAEALDILRGYHSRSELVALGVAVAPGLAVAGEVLPDLPASVRAIFTGGGPTASSPLYLSIVDQRSEALEVPIDGAARIDLEVRRTTR